MLVDGQTEAKKNSQRAEYKPPLLNKNKPSCNVVPSVFNVEHVLVCLIVLMSILFNFVVHVRYVLTHQAVEEKDH